MKIVLKYHSLFFLLLNVTYLHSQDIKKYKPFEDLSSRMLINFHEISPATDSITLPRNNSFSLFTVLKNNSAKESRIWEISSDKTNNTRLLTDRRFVDLNSFQFLNYFELINDNIKLVSLDFEGFSNETMLLKFNIKMQKYRAPIEYTSGPIVPELIIANKFSNDEQKQNIESYLALKYGITLKSNYINSAYETIWDQQKNETYGHNIAGIGRDDLNELFQKQSLSGNYNSEFSLTIGLSDIFENNDLNISDIPEMGYAIWGENGAQADFEEFNNKDIQKLFKNWKINLNQVLRREKFALQVSYPEIDTNYEYFIIIDRSAKGIFDLENTDFVKLNLKDTILKAIDIQWDRDGNQGDVFSIVKTKPGSILYQISDASCKNNSKGEIKIKQLSFKEDLVFTVQERNFGESIILNSQNNWAAKLNQGEYSIKYTTHSGVSKTYDFIVNGYDLTNVNLKEEYYLEKEQKIMLKINSGIKEFQWKTPLGLVKTNELEISYPGIYYLITKDGNCISQKQFKVIAIEKNNLEEFTLFPNPSDGIFKIIIKQTVADRINLRIISEKGSVYFQKDFDSGNKFLIEGRLNNSGVYFVELSNQYGKTTKKIIIQ